jgi:stage II sporulation protein D
MQKSTWIFISFLFSIVSVFAQDVWVKMGLLDFPESGKLNFEVHKGTYVAMERGDTLFKFQKGDSLSVDIQGSQFQIQFKSHKTKVNEISFFGLDYVNQLEVILPKRRRLVEDNLNLISREGKYFWINHIELEHYVAGVIEAEAGYGADIEFYKLQAILSRTYVIRNLGRFSSKGYDVCNSVQSQVYHHPATRNEIIKAAYATKDLVVVDERLQLIQTLFHSNSGGQTCNSEDVWGSELPYLRSRRDTFCKGTSNHVWREVFTKEEVENKYKVKDIENVLNICQDTCRIDSNPVVLKQLISMRKKMGLRSTFFYIDTIGDTYIFHGRGYGHGVGVSQQSAMEMAKQGYSYKDILNYYYTNVHVVNRRALVFFNEE